MINYTTLLKLAQPQPGTEDGSWGTTVNDALTSPLDIAVGGSATIDVTSGNVVLTNGDGSASNQARYAVLRITGTPGTTRNVEAPGGSTSRNWYVVRNESNGSVVIKENATTGVTIPAGKTAVVMWSGSDYVIATVAGASSSTDNAVARFDGTSGQLIQNSAVTIADTTGDITGGKYNGLTITTSTGTLTVANGKTFTASNTLTLTGTDGTTAAFGAGLTIAAGKTFGVNNSLTLAGTDSTTMTFPGTSATIARTDAAQTFTGIQTFSSAPVMSALTVSKPVFTSAGGALTSSGTLLTDQGGTGQTTYTAGDMVYYATGTAMTKLGIGTTNYVLTSSGSAPQWSAPASVVIGTATNIQGGAAGSVPYQSGASTTTFLGIGSAAQVLQVNSSGTAPEWVSSTGTGSVVRATSPTLVTPALGTPSTINLANATNLPLGSITGLGTGVATALAINVGSAGAFVPTTGSGASGTWTISINGNANTATTATTASTATNIASGGTNQVVYQSSSGSTSFTPSPSSGNLYLKWTGSAFTWDAPSGSGDVSGPASSTADGLVAFDGTSGKIIKAAGTVTVAQGGTGLTAFGSALQVLRVNASATALEYATVVTNPAGSNTEIQFNNSGAFGASANLTWDGSTLATTGLTASGAVTLSATTQNIALGTSQVGGTWTAGGASQTGAITLDQSTKTHTLNIGTGATENALTKTINLGTAGVSGSTTAINIGSAVSGATSSTSVNGALSATGNVTLSGGTANGVAYLNGSKVLTTGSALTFDGNTVRNNQSSGTNAYFRTTSGTVDAYFGAATAGIATGVVVGSFSNNDVVFYQNSTEAMRLTSTSLYTASGINVGIGTSSPAQTLHVKTSTSATPITFGVLSNATGLPAISFNGAYASTTMTGIYGNGATASNLYYTVPSGQNHYFAIADATKMTLDSSGNLGIGTSSPKIQEWRAGTYLTVANASTRGQIEIDGAVADSGSASLGALIFTYSTNTTNHKDVALIEASSSGATANQRGGVLNFYTKANGTASPALNMTLDASGNLLVGTTSGQDRIVTKGATSDNSKSVFLAVNSSDTQLCLIRNDGVFYTGVAAASPYNNTTASAANLFVASGGDLFRSTSSLKYKQNVQNAIHGLAELLTLRPVIYEGKAASDAGKTFGGLIAEEVHDAGLTEFVQYAEDGTPDALAYGNMVSLCIKAIQEQQALIESLTSRVAQLEGTQP